MTVPLRDRPDLYQPYTAAGTPRPYFSYNGGLTRRAVIVYARYMADPLTEREPDPDELRLLVDYCDYFINAPCLVYPADELRLLRLSILRVTSAEQLAGWLWGCASIGLGIFMFVGGERRVDESQEADKHKKNVLGGL